MSLATGKQLHAFIWTKLPINNKVIYIVNDLSTKEKQLEMTKGYPIFECSPVIPITDKYNETQNEDSEIASTNEDENDDDITEN